MSVRFKVPGSRLRRPARQAVRQASLSGEQGALGSIRAFTLIELMVAVGIMAIILTIAIPSLNQSLHQDSMRKAVQDVMDACREARARAILDGVTMELRIRPGDRQLTIAAGPVQAPAVSGNAFGFADDGGLVERAAPASSGGGASVKLSDRIVMEGLGVNGEDWTEDEEAAVRFYPNGTSDEMSMVLYAPSSNERRNITLEVVTGMADVETDTSKFKAR